MRARTSVDYVAFDCLSKTVLFEGKTSLILDKVDGIINFKSQLKFRHSQPVTEKN